MSLSPSAAYTPRASLSVGGNRGSAAILLTDTAAQLCAALFDRRGYPAPLLFSTGVHSGQKRNREEAAGRSQRLREHERGRLMAIFALTGYAREFGFF